jgi:hypothetical protein
MRHYIIAGILGLIATILICAAVYPVIYQDKNGGVSHSIDDGSYANLRVIYSSKQKDVREKGDWLATRLQWLYFWRWYLEYVGYFAMPGAILPPLILYVVRELKMKPPPVVQTKS